MSISCFVAHGLVCIDMLLRKLSLALFNFQYFL